MIIESRPIDQDHIRVALLTYSNDVRFEFTFNSYDNESDIIDALDRVVIAGNGRLTSKALEYFLDNLQYVGRRPNLPVVLILLTNGRSTEDRLKLMLTGWKIQAEAWCNAYGKTNSLKFLV